MKTGERIFTITRCMILMTMVVILFSSCASGRHSYRKPKRPSKCDCSRWSYIDSSSIYYLNAHAEGIAGRA